MKKRCISFIRKSTIAVFCTFTAFSHCLFGYASNDDEYITFNTFEAIQAYQYWKLYGFTADSYSTYTDTYITNGSINLGNVNISLSSNGSIGGSGTSVSSFEGMWHSFVGTGEDTYTLDIAANNIATVNPTNTTPSHLTLACTFNTTSGGYLTDGTCSDSSFTDIGRYNVSLNAANDVVTITGSRADTYAIFRSTANPNYDAETNSDLSMYSADSFSGSLNFNSSGGLSGSGIISATTTTTNTNKLSYVLPFMAQTNKLHPTSTLVSFYNYNDDPFILAYFSNTGRNNNLIRLIDRNTNEEVNFNDYVKLQVKINSGLILYYLETKAGWFENHSLYYDFDDNYFIGGYSHIPLYVGYKSRMSDSVYRYLYGQDRIEQAIKDLKVITQNGTIESQDKGQELDTKTNQMSNKMTEFQNIEDTAGDNMNNALNNINTNPSLLSNNKFLMSADWIRQQFNRIVSNTPFEAVITFCLVFGLGLLLLGKVR